MIPTPFRWGPPTFNAGEGFTMMAASFVALVEVCSLNNQIFQLCFPTIFGIITKGKTSSKLKTNKYNASQETKAYLFSLCICGVICSLQEQILQLQDMQV